MSVITPAKAWVATLNAGGFVSHGQSMTLTVNLTGVWEGHIPIGARYGTGVSLPTLVQVFPSHDGGASWDTIPLISYTIPTAPTPAVEEIPLTCGQYAIAVTVSSPSVTLYALTFDVISAYLAQ